MILLTGASGMIGRALLRRFFKMGFSVRAQGRNRQALERLLSNMPGQMPLVAATAGGGASEKSTAPLLDLVESDFATLSQSEAEALCRGCSVVVHVAGLVHNAKAEAKDYELLNVRATELLADAARCSRVSKFVFFSSSSVYGNRATKMIAETAELHADTPYAASKIRSEELLRANPPAASTVVVRPALVFGEGDRGNMLPLMRQVLSGKYFLIGTGEAEKSLIFADDLAAIVAGLVETELSGFHIFNAAYENPVTVKELSEAILQAAGRRGQLLSVPESLVNMAAQAANSILGQRSPLSPDRLAKLTRDNSISLLELKKIMTLSPQLSLKDSLAVELAWARRESLIR